MDDLDYLVQKRKPIRSRLTRLCNQIDSDLPSLTVYTIDAHIVSINKLMEKLENDCKITKLKWQSDKTGSESEFLDCAAYQDKAAHMVSKLQVLSKDLTSKCT